MLTIRQVKESTASHAGYRRKITLGPNEITELLRFWESDERQDMYGIMARLRELVLLRIAHLGGRRIGTDLTDLSDYDDVPEPESALPAPPPPVDAPLPPSVTDAQSPPTTDIVDDESIWNTIVQEQDCGTSVDDGAALMAPPAPPPTSANKRPYQSSSTRGVPLKRGRQFP